MISKLRILGGVLAVVFFCLSLVLIGQLVSAAATSILVSTSDGNYLQWTPKSGTSHFAMVDETPCNGTTDYNFTNTVGNRDSYGVNISSVPSGAVITDIAIAPCASRNATGSGSSTMNIFYRLNGADSSDAGNYVLTTGTTPTNLATTTFSGLSIVKRTSTTLEIGAVLSSGNKGARLSRIATQITYTPLNAPSNLTGAASTTAPAIGLAWTDNSSTEDGFVIERKFSFSSTWSSLATTSANLISYDDTTVQLGQTYNYRVRASNSGGYSSYSNIATTTAPNVPAKPSGLTGTASSSDVILNWNDNSSNEDGFNIWRSSDGINYTSIATTTADTTAYTDAGLGSGTWYHRVRAFSVMGYSAFSNTATTTIP